MLPVSLVGLHHNRQVSRAELASCRDLTEAIAAAATGATGGPYGDEQRWMASEGGEVHADRAGYTLASFDDNFVRFLRLESYIFSGWRLTDVLKGSKTPSWTDIKRFPHDDELPDWSVAYFLSLEGRDPPVLVCEPPVVCGEAGWVVNGRCVNRDVAMYQDRINSLQSAGVIDRLRGLERPRILEIGGGYGGLAYFLTRFVPKAHYTIVDLPSSLMHSGCYLTVAQKTHPVDVWRPDLEDGAPRVTLVPNTAAESIAGSRFDLAINTLSFAEMHEDVVRAYGRLIARVLAPGGQLFEQNFTIYGPETSHCTPEDVLKEMFPVRRDIAGDTLFNPPRLWSLA